MNNSLPTTQWTTLTDLLWPQAVLRRIVLLMGYKEGSVCRLSALFRLWCSILVCLALPSQHCNIQLMRGQQQRRSLTHTLTRTRKVHTSSQQGMGISTENTEHEMKTLMYTHLHTCSHKNMHTLQLWECHTVHLRSQPPAKTDLFLFPSSTSSHKEYSMSTADIFKKDENVLALFRYFQTKIEKFTLQHRSNLNCSLPQLGGSLTFSWRKFLMHNSLRCTDNRFVETK